MAATDAATALVGLGPEALDACLTLSDEAGWNQTQADWAQFLSLGLVFGHVTGDGEIVATAALHPYPPATWVSMVLVTQAWRRRGLANALMRRCLEEAKARGLTPWLDATPAGATVYGPMGFVETGRSFLRLRRPVKNPHAEDPRNGVLKGAGVENASAAAGHLARLIACDRQVIGLDRTALLEGFAARLGTDLYATDHAACLVRDGRTARHIGPVYAAADADALALFDACLSAEPGPLIVDLLDSRHTILAHLQTRGFVVERPFVRMRHGAPAYARNDDMLIASAGPEYG